jgi:hypothetical protein
MLGDALGFQRCMFLGGGMDGVDKTPCSKSYMHAILIHG